MNYPDRLKPGTLLRIKKQCRENSTVKECGEYAILANKQVVTGKNILWDVLFPNGRRCIYMPMNWEVLSESE